MKSELEIGTVGGKPFTLPLDLVTRTLAILGIRGWGKTVAATVVAEEMCEAGLPWVAIDPVGVWWGLRANRDGTPGGYQVVILGGEHGDLPLDEDSGSRVADAVVAENASCIIDMSSESKNAVRRFVTAFCDRLMELRPAIPRHIFLEEAPELVPQKPLGEQKRSLAAVDRLIRLGRNRGYGATLISQRTATINKDVLTQCENLIAGRSIGKPDRDAMQGWIAEVARPDSEEITDEFMKSLSGLDSGNGWFWSPQWLNRFCQIQIRERKTYHPGETRTVGQAVKQVKLLDVREFVDRFGKILKTEPATEKHVKHQHHEPAPVADPRDAQIIRLQQEVNSLRQSVMQANGSLIRVRQQLEPQYRMMQQLFGDTEHAVAGNGKVDASVWQPWKDKFGGGIAKIIDILLERGTCTKVQLGTLTGLSRESIRIYVNKLASNQLIEKDGSGISLRQP